MFFDRDLLVKSSSLVLQLLDWRFLPWLRQRDTLATLVLEFHLAFCCLLLLSASGLDIRLEVKRFAEIWFLDRTFCLFLLLPSRPATHLEFHWAFCCLSLLSAFHLDIRHEVERFAGNLLGGWLGFGHWGLRGTVMTGFTLRLVTNLRDLA